MELTVFGSGGGKGGGGGGVSESPDTLRSSQTATVLDALCEGPIAGLVNSAQSVYLNKVPLQNADGTWNFNQVIFGYTTGTLGSNQHGASALTGDGANVESTVQVAQRVFQATPVTVGITTANVDAVLVTVDMPNGIYAVDTHSGQVNGSTVEFEINVQANGGGWITRVHDTINGKSSSDYSRSYMISLAGLTGPFDVQVVRITPDSGSTSVVDNLYFESYTAIVSTKLEYRHTAMAYVAIDAQQFSSIPSRAYDVEGLIINVPSNYNPATRTYTGTWDGTFQLAYSNNPAWCFYDLVTNNRYGLGEFIPAASVNKWQLYQIGQYCDQMVPDGYGGQEPRFTCNLLLQNQQDAFTVVQQMAAIFRAMTFWSAGTLAISQDAPASPVAMFGPANVIGGSFSYQNSSLKTRHNAVAVTWNDPNQFYAPAIEYVQIDELVNQYGLVMAQIGAMGCTSRGQAHRVGAWLLYTENYETETVTFKTALDGFFLTPGSIIQTSDPNRAGVRMAGRVLAVDSTGTVLTLDAAPPTGQSFTIQVAMPDGTLATGTVGLLQGAQVTLTSALPLTPVQGAVYMLSSSTVQPELWRVITTQESAENEVTVTALSYNPSKYALIENGAPLVPQSGPSTLIQTPNQPQNLDFLLSRKVSDTGSTTLIGTLSWTGNGASYIVTEQAAGGNVNTQNTMNTSADFAGIELGMTYNFTVTAVSATGIKGPPASLSVTPTLSMLNIDPLTAATNLVATGGVFSITLNWSFTTNRTDLDRVEIWGSQTDNLATASMLASVPWPGTQWTMLNVPPSQIWFFWIRVVDKAGEDGPWYPASSTAGVQGQPSTDPSYLLDQLTAAIGAQQLIKDLQTPIAAIPSIIADQNASGIAALQSALQFDSAFKQINFQQAVNDATVTVDPNTGKITLIATAPIVTSELAQITQISSELDAVQGTLNNTVQTLSTVQGNLTAAQSQISQLAGEVSLSATTTYVDSSVARLSGQFTTESANAANQLATAILQSALNADQQNNAVLQGNASVAAAKFDLKTLANAQTAQATAQLNLASLIGQNAAALSQESTTRANADSALSQQITNLGATVQTNNSTATAAIQSEASTRANADSALAQQITNLQSTVTANNNTLTAAIQSEATTRANADSALSQTVQTVQANLNGQIASVQQTATATASTVAGLSAQWVLKVDANGHIAGMTLASGQNSSQIVFTANSLTFAQPNGAAQPLLEAGTVNGVNAVGIGGNLILDGSITANSAAIADAAIGTAQIQNEAVQTANIADLNVNGYKITGTVNGTLSINNNSTVQVNTGINRPPVVALYPSTVYDNQGNPQPIAVVSAIGNGYFKITNPATVAITVGYGYL